MRQLATIQQILDVQPIEGADSIEKVQVKGWWCVAKKGEFKAGDRCVYFEIDSLLPSSNPAFSFLEKGTKKKTMKIDGKEYVGYRLKTIKLRGQLSQGLALPIPMLFELPFNVPTGEDVSEMLDIVKYEMAVPAHLAGKAKGTRPGFVPKTDEERIQNLGYLIEQNQGNHFYITEKLDGSSASYFRRNGVFGVCSRNMELIDTPENTFWEMARKYKIADTLPDGFLIQGELVGESIQSNPLNLKGHDLYIYNVYSFEDSKYLDFDEFVEFVKKLGLKIVPVLDEGCVLKGGIEDILKMADGKSVLSPLCNREGIVFRPLFERYATIAGTLQRLSFKAISNDYLLKHE